MSDLIADLHDARRRGDALGASLMTHRLLDAAPPLGGRWAEVADAALEMGDEVGALRAAQAYTRAMPNDVQAWTWLAAVQAMLGQHEAALKSLEPWILDRPGDGGLQFRAGRCLYSLGRPRQAEMAFRRALAVDPVDALAWEGLSACLTFETGGPELLQLEKARIQADGKLNNHQRGILSYALSKAYRDTGDLDVAAIRVTEGAAFIRDGKPFDVNMHESAIEGIVGDYKLKCVEAGMESGVPDTRPVMIIAPPESGVEWLATVLSADPSAGALVRTNGLLWLSSARLGDRGAAAMSPVENINGRSGVSAEIVKQYLRQAEDVLATPEQDRWRRIIDPTSVSEMVAGVFGMCLPMAKLVRITRNVRDLAWSIYRTRYRRARHWTYHPDDIARVLACHNTLADHWQAVFGNRMITVRYEDMLAEPRETARRVARFVGVDADIAGAEAWLRAGHFKSSPVGVHAEAEGRFEPLQAALERSALI